MHQILALWAHPRSLSTALERIFIERGDFAVMHEPFSVVYYLREQRAAAVKASFQPDEALDYAEVCNKILRQAEDRPVCFKDMCYHCHDHLRKDGTFLQRLTNVFLIRDPRQAIASHYAKNPTVTIDEIGYEQQARVFRQVTQQTGQRPVVIAAETLQQQPAGTMRTLCQAIGLDDRPEALSWQAGSRPEWEHWKAWHDEVAQSHEIRPDRTEYPDTVDNHADLARFYRHHRPFYEELHQHRIEPSA